MNDVLIVAKQKDYDVFNALDIMLNECFLKELKFGHQTHEPIQFVNNFTL